METFEQGKWYRLFLECVGDDAVVHVEGKKALRATSKDFHVKKPGIEFRVLGRNRTEVSFDNLRVWELQPTAITKTAPIAGQRIFICGHIFTCLSKARCKRWQSWLASLTRSLRLLAG